MQPKTEAHHPYFCGAPLPRVCVNAEGVANLEGGSRDDQPERNWRAPLEQSRRSGDLRRPKPRPGRAGNVGTCGRAASVATLIEVGIEESLVQALDPGTLPQNWRSDPAPDALKRIGDEWLTKARSPVLRVPSALVPEEYNFLLNTQHPWFQRLSFGDPAPFRFDPCLIKNG